MVWCVCVEGMCGVVCVWRVVWCGVCVEGMCGVVCVEGMCGVVCVEGMCGVCGEYV